MDQNRNSLLNKRFLATEKNQQPPPEVDLDGLDLKPLKISQGQLSNFAILCPLAYESAQLPMEPWRLLQYHGACPQTSTVQQESPKGSTEEGMLAVSIVW